MKHYVPEDARIHLVAHSLGSYLALELLKHPSMNAKISDVFLLFPTIEHIGLTKNAIFMKKYVKPIIWLVIFLSWFFTILPKICQTVLLYVYMFVTGISPSEHCENLRSLIKPSLLKRVFFLAFDEFDHIKDRNDIVIKNNISKIKFFYGEKDHWADQSYYEKLRSDIPNVNAQLTNVDHTFVLKNSVEIGCLVSSWISGKP